MGSCHEATRRPGCVAPRAGGTRLRVGGTRLRVGGATRWMISSLRSDEGGVGAVENLCIVRANPANELL